MIHTLQAPFGSAVRLDFRQQYGESVELDCFCFVTPPIEFRLVRQGKALQEWQAGNTDMYDLQHGPRVKEWERDGHWFVNDMDHKPDAMTCGLLSKDLVMETRGLAFVFTLQVWLRDFTWRVRG